MGNVVVLGSFGCRTATLGTGSPAAGLVMLHGGGCAPSMGPVFRVLEGGGFTTQLFLLSSFIGEIKSPWYEWGAAQIPAEKGVTAMPNLHGIQPHSGLSVAPMARILCSHRGHKLLSSDHLSSWCIWGLDGRICIHQRHPHFPLRHSPQLITPETRGIPVSHR